MNVSERMYILHGVKTNFRTDGRQRAQYRHIEVETNLIDHAFGSARIRLATTDVLVAVKVEVETPTLEDPDEGILEFFVDCSANATPAFEGRGGDELGIEISNCLERIFKATRPLDLSKLCIYPGRKCWKINVDVLILECGGNLYDAVSLAVKAGLHDTRVPKIDEIKLDGDNIELEISENESEYWRFDVTKVPVVVTLNKIEENCVVDPSNQEEECSVCSLVVAIADGKFINILKVGLGSFNSTTLIRGLAVGRDVGVELNRAIMQALREEDSINKIRCRGFLK